MSGQSGEPTLTTNEVEQFVKQWALPGEVYAVVSGIYPEMPSQLLIVARIARNDGRAEYRTARYTLNSDT